MVIILFFISIFSPVLAFSFEPAWLRPVEMRLNFINKTDGAVKIYLNQLNAPIIINQNDTFNSDIFLMDFENEYPFFIGVERHNDIIRFFAFARPSEINVWEYLYYVIINDISVYSFLTIGILSEASYINRVGLMTGTIGWRYFDAIDQNDPRNYLEILILNDTRDKLNIIYRDHEKELFFKLDEYEARVIRIFNPIFLQGSKFENKDFLFYSIEIEDKIISPPRYRYIIQMERNIQIRRLQERANGTINIRLD